MRTLLAGALLVLGCAEAPPAEVRGGARASAEPAATAAVSELAATGSAAGITPASAPAASSAEPSPAGPSAESLDGAAAARDETPAWQRVHWPAAPPAPSAGDRIYSKVRHLWVRPFAGSRAWLGYLALGDSVRVKGGDAHAAMVRQGDGEQCTAWYAVEPRGVVCTGSSATFDPRDPVVVELRRTAARRDSPWPYGYAESLGLPIYDELPSEDKQHRSEPALDAHLEQLARARKARRANPSATLDASLEGVPLRPAGHRAPFFPTLGPGGKPTASRVVAGSTMAYASSFDLGGRSFVVTWDRGIAPRDKLRPYPHSSFHGVALGQRARLPIAFFRGGAQPKYRRAADGFAPAGGKWPRLSWVGLTGNSEQSGGHRFFETREPGLWCSDRGAAIARRVDAVPAPIAQREAGRRTWLDVSILGGTLVAYEAGKPVYVTLISPGRGGVPARGIPTLKTASTPTGLYPIVGKFVTATMVSSSSKYLVHAEVPFTQNFTGPYSLHGAYWHDRWGERKSGGCVNLAPIDAQAVFAWTEPRLPAGWHGMRTADFGEKTLVSLHR